MSALLSAGALLYLRPSGDTLLVAMLVACGMAPSEQSSYP